MSPSSPSSTASNLVGKTLGHFRIVARLGEGGMGVVYRAVDEKLRRPVALKVLPDEAIRDETRRRRFLREARSAAAVVHANVAAVHEVDESQGYVYIAMELVEGTSLRSELSHARRGVSEYLRIAKGIARALAKAHEKGIVHRDLKPDNVMLNEDREVKVLDFGLAKLLDGDEARALDKLDETASHDTASRLMGTPAYMSPEQATGRAIDARSDVFSFGVILYEMLTGKRPFKGESAMETLVAVARDDAPPVSSLASIPAAIELILVTCMQKNPEQRYPSGRELAAALEAFDAGQQSVVDVGSLPTLLASNLPSVEVITHATKRRRPVAWKMAAVVTVTAVALVGVVLLTLRHEPAPKTPAPAVAAPVATFAPRSANPEAAELMARAQREEHEGRHDLACADRVKASDLDPKFAPAALAAAVCNGEDPRTGRKYFRRAWTERTTLAPNDLAFLTAEEPIFQRDPEDARESLARLQAAEKRFPDDPRLHFAAGSLLLSLGTFQDQLSEVETSLGLDPDQPYLLEILADHADYSGDFVRGQAAIDDCLRLIPSELGCLEEQSWVDGESGKCSAVEGDARRILAVDPNFEDGITLLANALDAQGAALPSVRQLLKRRRDVQPAEVRAATERRDEIQIDLLTGDFAGAEKLVRAWGEDVKDSPVAADHADVARLLVMIEEETGRPNDAAVDAAAYLDGRDGWEPNARFEDWAMSKEPTAYLLGVRLHAGAISQTTYDREIGRTVDRWETRVVPHLKNFVWIYSYAVPAETPDEAKIALGKRASYLPLPSFTPLTLLGADIGRTYLLAGLVDDAIPTLEKATANCFPVDHPMETMRASYFLGQAREAKKDEAGACAAYDVVRDRWEHAKPRSVTAQKAMARMAALGCDTRKK